MSDQLKKNIIPSRQAAAPFSAAQSDLLANLLEQMLVVGGSVPALKFRAEHYSDVGTLDELESSHWLKRENDYYIVQSSALPFLDTEPAHRLLSNIERLYAVFRTHYRQSQQAQVLVFSLPPQTQLPLAEVTSALRLMLDTPIWCAGWSTDLHQDDSFISPSEAILKHETFTMVLEEVRSWSVSSQSWHASPAFEPLSLVPQINAKANEATNMDNLLRAWPPVRACLQEFNFYDIKEVIGLAGLDVTATAHLVQKAQGGASKGQLMSAVDEQVRLIDSSTRMRFLTIGIEEILRRRPNSLDRLSEYLSRLGWSFVNQTLVPIDLLDPDVLIDTPDESHHDLLKAAQRLRDGDLGGAISAACGAVDAATSKVYDELSLGDPTAASFQERCKKATLAKGVVPELENQLKALGWSPADVLPFKKNLEGALNQGAYVMQTLRSHMGDVHGTKPILRSLVFDCLRWAGLLVGSLVERSESTK